MRFGVFYELQLPKPWTEDDEHKLVQEALEQIVLADKLGIDYAWAVEHHFLEEYSHCSAPETFLAAAAGRTKNIKLGHGIRQVIPNYNHPSRTAEVTSMLDLVSNGRAQLGFGEGATRMELHGYNIQAKTKRTAAIEAIEQVANMMTMNPYPGFEGEFFSMPCRNVVPKPLQKPHPPLWMACSNRDTIKVAASLGVGALAFSFVDPSEAKHWADIYYDIIKSDQCVPVGHSVNANIAMVSSFSVHEDRAEAIRRGQDGFEFFSYALSSLVTKDTVPGRTTLWKDFHEIRGNKTEEIVRTAALDPQYSSGIGTPEDITRHMKEYEDAGVDQLILLQQAGRNKHEEICRSLNMFAKEVLPAFKDNQEAREARKARELAPYIEAALARKKWMASLADDEIPVIRSSVSKVKFVENRAGKVKAG
ncbi:MAG: LLM class flavin-dependent oxidoreductase [Proteobacteria bacterium]|nr:LLM class flavin-dependent oxidoreductase [Pseudomonadota bacterium]